MLDKQLLCCSRQVGLECAIGPKVIEPCSPVTTEQMQVEGLHSFHHLAHSQALSHTADLHGPWLLEPQGLGTSCLPSMPAGRVDHPAYVLEQHTAMASTLLSIRNIGSRHQITTCLVPAKVP
jgi:hypothetical protein